MLLEIKFFTCDPMVPLTYRKKGIETTEKQAEKYLNFLKIT
jgi:hypothetical protein